MLRNVRFPGLNLLKRFSITNPIRIGYAHHSSENGDPVKFSISKARKWKASYSRIGMEGEDEAAWFQPYVVSASVTIFLIYFCVLREENDIDEALKASLFDKIEGLEEAQLKRVLSYNLEHGIDTKEIKARLKELEMLKEEK